MKESLILDLAAARMTDVASVGGKSASHGEMISQLGAAGVRVPGGFATTAHAYRQFLAKDRLAERISQRLASLDAEDVKALAAAGKEIREWIVAQPFPAALKEQIAASYKTLCRNSDADTSFAGRSSATAEGRPDPSVPRNQAA